MNTIALAADHFEPRRGSIMGRFSGPANTRQQHRVLGARNCVVVLANRRVNRVRSKCCTSPHGAAVRHRPCQNTRWAASEHGERGNPAWGGFATGVLHASRWVPGGTH